MKRITLSITAIVATIVLTGCQSLPNQSFGDRKVFKAPSFYGKELPSAFIRNHHKLNESNGHNFRGYEFGKRHWL